MNIPQTITDPNKRYDFLIIYDVTDGNPNGDPDASNQPRIDLETSQGIVTDVCLKRKIRNYVDLKMSLESEYNELDQNGRFGIFIRDSGVALNTKIEKTVLAEKPDTKESKKTEVPGGREAMCAAYYDIRLFGAVLSTGKYNSGQVRGPMQLTFSRSVDPILPADMTITRSAITKEGEDKETEIGKKPSVPYGLYVGKGFYSPALAKSTGLDQADLALFWEALTQMFEHDRSAARGDMRLQQVYVFAHESPLGNAPSGKLFDRVSINKKEGVNAPRHITDYTIAELNEGEIQTGVTLHKLLPE